MAVTKERHKHPDTAWPFYPDVVPLKFCKRFEYQREPSSVAVDVERDFKPELAGTLTLSKRSNTVYALVDGGTRHHGMTKRGMKEWLAIVFEGLTPQEEARMFADFVRRRRGMHSAESYNAELFAGEPITVAINAIIADLGFEVGKNSGRPEVISAPAALRSIFLGCTTGKKAEAQAIAAIEADETTEFAELLTMTLELIKLAWPDLDGTAKGRAMLLGLATFLLKNGMDIDQDKLVLRLSHTTAPSLWQDAQDAAKGARKTVTTDKPGWMAHAIGTLYNQRNWKPSR